jgi:hypothetical protein
MGVLLVAMGTCVHEWTLERVLPESMPMRASARLHWWYLSLNTWGVGLWLIVCRHRIQPVAVVMVVMLYGLLGAGLVALDMWRAYSAVTQGDPRRVEGEYHALDDRLGWSLKPEGRARVIRDGVYDVEYTIDAAGRRRTVPQFDVGRTLMVLGDSFAFGWGVNDDETFSSRMAAQLGTAARVVNAGVEGHGLTQMYVRFLDLRHEIKAGDIVLLTLIGDDIGRNWSDFLFVARMLFGPKRVRAFPAFEDGHIRIHHASSRAKQLKALLVHAPWLGSVFGPALLPPPGNAMEDAGRMVATIRREVEARGASFLIVQLPTGGEFRKKHERLDLSRLGALQIWPRFPPDTASLDEVFLSDDDGHYAPLGHRLVANVLLEELARRAWIPR